MVGGTLMAVTILNTGSDILERYFRTMPEMTARAMRLAINGTVKGRGMTEIKKQMLNEIAFPNGYLNGDRLKVATLATDTRLEASIVGRKRATSLARFVTGNPVVGSKRKDGLSVRVKSGRTTYLKNAFLVKLNKGASYSEDNYNVGLAVRLAPGEQLSNKNSTHKAWLVPRKVARLYGPSVDQVFEGVSVSVGPALGDMVAAEFYRQFERI